MLRDILSDKDEQARAVVAVVRASRADVILLGGIDYDLHGVALDALAERVGGYPHRFSARPNRGLPTGIDLDGDGKIGGAGDAHGYGAFAGKSGLAILSRFPIWTENTYDFSAMAWRDLPGNMAPEGTPGELRLSTTAHWDIPIDVGNGQSLHLLVWHATPPAFDARNPARNHDETALWLRYLDGDLPREPPESFVILGDANLDPVDGDGMGAAIHALLDHPRVTDPRPASAGAALATGGVNDGQRGDPSLDTADWEDTPGRPGNLRVDYVLPSSDLTVLDAGVLWPVPGTLLSRDVETASRHRLVWVDIGIRQGGGKGDQGVGVAEVGQ